jgi:hypothetical protein
MNVAEGEGSCGTGGGLGPIGCGEGPNEGLGVQESPSPTMALGHGPMTGCRRWPKKQRRLKKKHPNRLSGTMIRGTQIMDKTFSSTKTKQGHPQAVIRLARDWLGQQPPTDRFSASPRPRYNVSDAGSSPTHPTPASDTALPLARSRPPVTLPTSLRRPIRQTRRDRGQITTPSPITA